MQTFKNIKIIAFDADDTLWHNEPMFRRAEKDFYALLTAYSPPEKTEKLLFKTEMKNLPLYGYGIKAFTLSMIETALKVSDNTAPANTIGKILNISRAMLTAPVSLLPGVEQTLKKLSAGYKIIVATKGDLLDQHRKLYKSGVAKYLHHIEVMREKDVKSYQKLLKDLDIKPQNFVMIGNSIKSDILPVLEIGGNAIYIPHPDTWAYEQSPPPKPGPRFTEVRTIKEVLRII